MEEINENETQKESLELQKPDLNKKEIDFPDTELEMSYLKGEQ